MKGLTRLAALLPLLMFLGTGCVTHKFFLNLTSTPALRYTIEGDSVDVYDGRLSLPDKVFWTLTGSETGENSDGTPSVRYSWAVSPLSRIGHPLGPEDKSPEISSKTSKSIFHRSVYFRAEFPSWDAKERYGDPEKYMPEALLKAVEDPMFDSLHPGKRDELEGRLLDAQLSAAIDRYDGMLLELVKAGFEERGRMYDDEAYAIESVRFFAKLKRLAREAKALGEEDPDTDWYDELRLLMAETLTRIHGTSSSAAFAKLDSLEMRYKRWLDLRDENIEFVAVVPGFTRTNIDPDTTFGDTLQWEFSGEALGDRTVVLEASAWSPRPGGVVLLILVLGAVLIWVWRSHKTGPARG
jgi:hypothetical protein